MFGDFYNNHKVISSSDLLQLEDGTPIVRMTDYFPYYQFGIYNNGRVIQQCFNRNLQLTSYEEISIKRFIVGNKTTLFEYTPIKYTYDKNEVLRRAKSCLNTSKVGVFSVFGDDFVFWCLVGDKMESFFTGSKMGRHYKDKYTEKIIRVYHHAIAIEEDVIVHFTDEEIPNETVLSFNKFSSLENPIEVKYKNDSYEQRMISRNRAIYAWATYSQYGKYNFITNNCEHFATWCRTGKGNSYQVRNALLDVAIGCINLVTPKAIPLTVMRFMKYFR